MVCYQNLYVGRLIAARKEQVIDEISRGDYPSGVYVILVPRSRSSQLEVMAATQLRHDWIREHCLMIVGLALGKTEAQSMVEALVMDVYSDRGDADIRSWLSEEHG